MKTSKVKKEGYTYLNLAAVIACLAVIAVILLAVFSGNLFSGDEEPSQPTVSEDGTTSEESVPAEETSEDISLPPEREYAEITMRFDEVSSGDLILVSNVYNYDHPSPESLVSIFENKTSSYKCGDTQGVAEKRALDAFNSMMDDFYSAVNSDAVTVLYGYLTPEEVDDRYHSSSDPAHTPQAGGSDFQTGLSFSLTVYPQSEGSLGDGKFAYLEENAHRFGFVLRYPEGKTDVTGNSASSGHYRYVGIPAASYIKQQNICLEEFLDEVRGYTVESPLSWSCESGSYQAYFCKSVLVDDTVIRVPAGAEYTVSGNNIDGFVVIVDVG